MDPSQSDTPRSSVAWNGVSLMLPDNWQPVAIERQYLLFASDDVPALELKWYAPAETEQVKDAAAQLEERLENLESFSRKDSEVPLLWRELLEVLSGAFDVTPFVYASGSGAICMHREYGMAMLLQIATPVTEETAPHIKEILASIRYDGPEESGRYRMYDLACKVPAEASLVRHVFRPGHFSLEFSLGDDVVRIERFSPANVVLQGSPFRAWIQQNLGIPLDAIRKDKSAPPSGAYKWYKWVATREPGLMDKLPFIRKFRERHLCAAGAAWIDEDHNKLVTVCIDSAEAQDEALLNELSRHVEIV